MDEEKSVVVVNLAINTGPHAILGTDRKTLYFDAYPSTDDLKAALVEDVKFTELLALCEVEEVATYMADFTENEDFVSFECQDEQDVHVGSIVIEKHPVCSSNMVVI